MRALAVISAGAVVAGTLAGVPAVAADGADGTLVPGNLDRPALEAGRYVVLLKAPAAASYRGGDAGLAATRVAPGRSFDARRGAVRAYTGHLRAEQARLARSVGAEVRVSYTITTNGFAAELTGRQASKLAADGKVLLVSKDEQRSPDTWNTPDFLGLTGPKGAWKQQAGGRKAAGQGTVVGVIDSGIWPESKSFAGRRLTRAPQTRWDISRRGTSTRMEKADGGVFTGQCQTSHDGAPAEQWNVRDCNTKLIGARYYPDAFLATTPPESYSPTEVISARDSSGHGTHTASTAAGQKVRRVKVEGSRFGTVSGMAPGARIAAYKVCFDDDDDNTGGCYNSAILSAIEDAVADGVDVINFSISGARDTVVDPVEFAFAGAAEAGVFVAASAGNSGPDASTVAHNSPWLTTVAAATHTRFVNTVVLGNGRKVRGASVATAPVPQTPLVESSTVAADGVSESDAALCVLGSLDPAKVAGKIVLCTRGAVARVEKSEEVAAAGGVAMILANPTPNSLNSEFHSVPTVHVSDTDAPRVFDYVEAQGAGATAAIRLGDRTGLPAAPLPQVAGFSSRGPALANDGDLLKPDISGPGVDILAAVSPPSNSGRRYDLYSGTSMSSPHIAGLANFLIAQHPTWTPMQVKSAMMTTARDLRSSDGRRSKDVFAQGAGHVRPKKFSDPGLFVVSDGSQWAGFLQEQGLDLGVDPLPAKDLNGPSMADGEMVERTSFTREFVASRAGTWRVKVHVPGFAATAPAKLVSKRTGDRESLTLELVRTTAALDEYAMGHLTLTGPTRVRLPIAVRPVALAAPAEVSGTGVSGSVEVPLTSADDRSQAVTPHGLARSTYAETSVAAGGWDSYCISLAPGARLARFDLDAVDDAADLDLYVDKVDVACDPDPGVVTDSFISATGSADERVDLHDPEGGDYIVWVHGYSAAPGGSSIDYRFDLFEVPTGAGEGALTADPNPVPLMRGEESSYQAAWSSLDPGQRYLGVLQYDGSPLSTLIDVDTRPAP